ncbi:hypothetical protein [Inconstantimicrobium mannanitabidum]|uniref:Uncharacterized protein n=1 Tax=Inconstantimicrobium mannanitabidum TaxID=1604901 RepID=A0ACB5RHQ9_9CLOT|nr:hypothetical protein [Clostridium sp. TW13]GKX68630.1 hypothetical protein rsdtw13_38880 [Clostridium sp. TW13]
MSRDKWRFIDKPNIMVITTKSIIDNKIAILSVWHDADDGMWQFLDGTDVNEDDAILISLENIVNIDNSVNEVSNLPLGWVAWREEKGFEWKTQSEI